MMHKIICTKSGKECIGQYLCKEGRRWLIPCPYMKVVWLYQTTNGWIERVEEGDEE